MPNNAFLGKSLLHIHVTAETTIDIERFPSSSIKTNFSRLKINFSETVTRNIMDMITHATCLVLFSHYEALKENIQNLLDLAAK